MVVKYKNQKTLKALLALSEELGFTISKPQKVELNETYEINGIPVEKADETIDMNDLRMLLTCLDFDAKDLRKSTW